MKSIYLFVFLLSVFHSACGLSRPKQFLPKDISTPKDRKTIIYLDQQILMVEKSNPDSSVKLIHQGLKLARKVHYYYGEAVMLQRLGHVNERYGNLTVALKYFREAHDIFLHSGTVNDIADVNVMSGCVSGKMHRLKMAQQFLNKALVAYQQKSNLPGQIHALLIMGQANETNSQFSVALDYYLSAENLLQKTSLSPAYFSVILHLGKIQEKLKNRTKALEYYTTGISKSDNFKFSSWHVQLLRQAGILWDHLGNHVTAETFHQRSLSKAQQYLLPEEEARSQISLAMSVRRNDAVKSIGHLRKALNLSKTIGNHTLTAEIFHSLSDLYQQQSHYQDALASLQSHHKLVDSLQNINIGHKLALLQGSYELAENKVHIQNLELINRKRTSERDAGLLILTGILIVLLIVGSFLYKTRKLNRQLKEANTTKDKLFSIIGHDLRNPIGGITQVLTLMDKQELNVEESREMVAKMRKQSEATLEILNSLLDWGQTQLKGIQLTNTTFSPAAYLAKNKEALRNQANDKMLIFNDTIPKDISLYGDANHFDFIIRNLLSNAIKFSNLSGTIELSAEKTVKGKVIFAVRDYGKGISEAQQQQFLKTNLDLSFGTIGEKGTGIGLLLSKEFLKAGGGEIWIKSKPGQGAIFYFSFKEDKSLI